jgi:hypothetical protein
MPDWATVASLATAGTTLVLAFATFASVRSANRAARAAERSLAISIRPLLAPSRLEDPAQKVGFIDDHWVQVPGSSGVADATEQAIYFVMSLRNTGNGIAVLHGWRFHTEDVGRMREHSSLEDFHRLTRDIYVSPGDIGFWQGALRDPATAEFAAAGEAIQSRRRFLIELLYGDNEGGQRTITLFGMTPRSDSGWLVTTARHWNVDRADPR